MEKLIEAFTENLKTSLEISNKNNLSNSKTPISNVLICGMGGSGIGGKLINDFIKNEIVVPIVLCSDYTIPNFVDKTTLVVASSYSGNTEETLNAVHLAHNKGANIVAICSGGELESFCKKNSYPFILVPGGNQPRAAIAYSLVQLLHVFSSYQLISKSWISEIEQSILLLDSHLLENKQLGKDIAHFLYQKVPVLYTESSYEGIGIRARQQLNENSKSLGWSHFIPEMNHNELVGWGTGDDRFAVLFIYTEDMNPRNRKRMDLTKQIVQNKTQFTFTLNAKGSSLIQRSLYLINVLDWASFYLHQLNEVDVFDIKVINHLKAELSKVD
ncbi:MAG: bifunctional phosphoglucose/phosphomannose isomerase [Flavobacteriia bacterium]|nr:bifunctional phosphoglucose/phosphomannose isomerase [Flavobacteriia bacterium]